MISLSILIPTFNTVCVSLVTALQRQTARAGISYEIIVADDGSTDTATVEANKAINTLPHSLYIIRSKNEGRSRTRNFLASQARHDFLLFIDSDMTVRDDDYIERYVVTAESHDVVYGGYIVSGDSKALRGNLRYRYETANRRNGSAELRRRQPYHDFHTSNFIVRRQLFLRFPLDERFRRYGYEDVVWGKTLQQEGIAIEHIDNALGFETFESNTAFVSKTEEGLDTLHMFGSELRGYSHLLSTADSIRHLHMRGVMTLIYRLTAPTIKRQLQSNNPSLLLFKLYKLLYFCNIDELRVKS